MSYLLAGIFIFLVLIAFLFSGNKIYNGVLLFFMWFLMAFSSETADYAIYYRRFYIPGGEAIEPLFSLLMRLFNVLGLNLSIFIACIMTVYVIVLSKYLTHTKIKANKGFVLALYCIYPFFMDIAQIRNTLSFIPILIGMLLFYDRPDIGDIKCDIKMMICILVSALFHYAGIFYIILILAKKLKTKTVIIVTVIFDILVFSMQSFDSFLLVFSKKFGLNVYHKVWTILNNVVMQNQHTIEGTQKMVVLTFVVSMLMLLYAYKNTKIHHEKIKYTIKLNILTMMILPLLNYAVDLFRIQRSLLIFTYVAFALVLSPQIAPLNKISVKTTILKLSGAMLPIMGAYINIIRSDLYEAVIIPVFFNNSLFK